jgi:hypothetical protein
VAHTGEGTGAAEVERRHGSPRFRREIISKLMFKK